MPSDPLVLSYVSFRGFQLAQQWRKKKYLIDNHPLEEAPFADGYFDATICINVLDHVQDPDICLRQLVRVTKRGGFLIIGQDLTSQEDLIATKAERERTGDVGHPHVFPHEVEIVKYLDDFVTIIRKTLKREDGRAPNWHSGTFMYVGRKRE